LSSQDPLDPMDNAEILQQVSQMREIASNDLLTESLESIKLGQNVATAASMIGRTIVALTDNAERIVGKVDQVSIEFGVPRLHVGEHVVDMRNVAGIASSAKDLEQGD
jgi:flagellar basal-body rod modification protein FlgD